MICHRRVTAQSLPAVKRCEWIVGGGGRGNDPQSRESMSPSVGIPTTTAGSMPVPPGCPIGQANLKCPQGVYDGPCNPAHSITGTLRAEPAVGATSIPLLESGAMIMAVKTLGLLVPHRRRMTGIAPYCNTQLQIRFCGHPCTDPWHTHVHARTRTHVHTRIRIRTHAYRHTRT